MQQQYQDRAIPPS